MTCEITIDAAGRVSDAWVKKSSVDSSEVERCITAELMRMEFPAPRGGKKVVEYPFSFSRS